MPAFPNPNFVKCESCAGTGKSRRQILGLRFPCFTCGGKSYIDRSIRPGRSIFSFLWNPEPPEIGEHRPNGYYPPRPAEEPAAESRPETFRVVPSPEKLPTRLFLGVSTGSGAVPGLPSHAHLWRRPSEEEKPAS